MCTRNDWKIVWNRHKSHFDSFEGLTDEQIVLELKSVDGFDVGTSTITYKAFLKEIDKFIEHLNRGSIEGVQSIFEVGCGSGANLYMFKKYGFKIGGIDYSKSLIDTMRKLPLHPNLIECVNAEAINLPTDIKYDAVVSMSVFHYFYDLDYAKNVLDKMLKKSKKVIAVLHIHDKSKEDEFFELRRRLTPDYNERYAGLPKLFYDKEFFIKFAKENNLDIEFFNSELQGFWNAPFVFNCFMYKI